MRPSKKQHIINTACKLFCEHGYQATGIDRVIEEAGIAKMTLYANFKSKEDLIHTCLRELDKQNLAWFIERVNASGSNAKVFLAVPSCELLANTQMSNTPFMYWQ